MKPNFCKGKQRQRTISELSHDFVSLLVELARNLNACFLRCHLDFVRGPILKVRMQSKGVVSRWVALHQRWSACCLLLPHSESLVNARGCGSSRFQCRFRFRFRFRLRFRFRIPRRRGCLTGNGKVDGVDRDFRQKLTKKNSKILWTWFLPLSAARQNSSKIQQDPFWRLHWMSVICEDVISRSRCTILRFQLYTCIAWVRQSIGRLVCRSDGWLVENGFAFSAFSRLFLLPPCLDRIWNASSQHTDGSNSPFWVSLSSKC